MLLTIQANNEARHIHYLLSDSNMALPDENTSMVNGFGETELVDTGLESAFKETIIAQPEIACGMQFGADAQSKVHSSTNSDAPD